MSFGSRGVCLAGSCSVITCVLAAGGLQVARPPALEGRVRAAVCETGVVSGATVTLDGRVSARTDSSGVYRFDRVGDTVAGLPAGDHVLTITAERTRTKVVRIALGSCPSPCTKDVDVQRLSGPACGGAPRGRSIDAADASAGPIVDLDRDGVDDLVEDWLAERFAPIVYHGESESTYPVNVEWLLQRTALFSDASDATVRRSDARTVGDQAALIARTRSSAAGGASGEEARSVCKRSGFFLADVEERDRAGERGDPRGWKTYVHSFANLSGGITIQYWRAYAYDRSIFMFADWGHGGDWEGLAVHLDAALQPESVGLLGHLGIERKPAREISWEGTHPIVWSEEGGHATRSNSTSMASRRFTRQETWSGGGVVWWDGRRESGGGLVNVGEKSHSRNGQTFIQYAGLWGSPHRLFVTSGYWGPAFNETGAVCDDGRNAYRMSLSCGARSNCARIFHTAWCGEMDGALLSLDRECYAPKAP